MHLAEGVIASPVMLGGGWVAACSGVAIGLRQLNETTTMRTAVMSSSFFVASLIHIPVFGVSIHLSLTALLGIMLGWAAFPAVFLALLLQAALFGFGGLTTLGLNTCIMALPSVAVFHLYQIFKSRLGGRMTPLFCGALGALAIVLASLLLAAILSTAGEAFRVVALSALAAQLPVVFLEGLVTASAATFLQKVSPELLAGATVHPAGHTPETDP